MSEYPKRIYVPRAPLNIHGVIVEQSPLSILVTKAEDEARWSAALAPPESALSPSAPAKGES